MGCQLYPQIGRSTPRRGSNLAIRTQSGPLGQRSLLITTFLPCKAHSQASAGHVVRLTCPQFQRPPSSGCKARQDMNTRCCYFLQSVFPHLRCELGLIRGRVKHSAKENCQWSTVADGALTGFPHNLKTCNMKWPQRTLSKISAFWKWQNYHSKFLIYFRAHSWCCTVYGFGQRYNDIYSLL